MADPAFQAIAMNMKIEIILEKLFCLQEQSVFISKSTVEIFSIHVLLRHTAGLSPTNNQYVPNIEPVLPSNDQVSAH